jgi:hypothetical protein
LTYSEISAKHPRRISHEASFIEANISKSWGIWYVTKYNPFMNLSWNKPPYQMTLIYYNGRVIMCGLEIADNDFSLTDEEEGA